MRTAFFGLHVATSGLHTARGALNVTSHNIANAEIPGFSRQVTQMQAGRPLAGTGRGMYGTGSQVTGVIQIRDRFLDKKFWSQNALAGRFTSVNQHLTFVETVFNNVSDVGVMKTFNRFFSTTQDLTTRAHELTFRTNVITTASSLTEQIRQNAASLQRQQRDLNMEFADVVTTINSLGNQLADINRQIHLFERNGDNANDLRDQRALLIDQLSELVNIEVDERDFSRPGVQHDRRLSILINGQMFVDHTHVNLLQLVPRDNPYIENSGTKRNEMDVPGLYDIFFANTGSRFDIHSPTLGGVLRGIVDVRDGNGGQQTAPPTLTGRFMIQAQLSALNRTTNFLNGIEARLLALASPSEMPAWVASCDAAFAAIEGTSPTNPVRNTTQANAWLTELLAIQTQREGYHATIASTRGALTTTIGLAGIRATIGVKFLNDNPGFNDLLNNIQSVLDEISNDEFDLDTFNLDAFTSRLEDAIRNLHTALDNHPDFVNQNLLNTLSSRADNLSNLVVPLRTALNNLETLNPDPNLDATITTVINAIDQLNTAVTNIAEITTFADRLKVQLDWAVSNVQVMINSIERRIYEIENGISAGNVEEYADLLLLLQNEIVALRNIAEALETMPSPSVYDDEAVLTAFINGLLDDLNGNEGITRFIEILEDIADAPIPDGRSIPGVPTTTFKGIPFYMNQLNELVRTFARAINEGRNRDGNMIPPTVIGRDANGTNIYSTPVGHIFGFDANGENRSALFFTFEDHLGNPAVLDDDDPFRSLRMWIMSETDADGRPTGVPQRDANGNFVTVSDPNPPVWVDPDTGEVVSLVAPDSTGHPMFTIDYSQFNAMNFIVNPDLVGNPSLLAASSNQNIGMANNDIIHGFAAVNFNVNLFREGRLIDFIIATSSHLGVDNHQAKLFSHSYSEITTQTHNHRLSVKSVDTEEEMMNLVRFQSMFIATSKLINVLDTVYDTLINRLGNF
ncbi:MAG: flagellar hook-associated protein FlgK [Defluviitaleaceae bacterium]|nr:flagellar hook-associated protein FlgK [Defluviitaleaceae bacterium]